MNSGVSPRVSDVLRVRDEVREGRIVGVVKVENISRPGNPEASPEWVFSRTCVLDDELNLLTFLKRKLLGEDVVGNILIIGDMGSGKSHLLLLAYHLFNQPELANAWLKKLRAGFTMPPTTNVFVIQVKEVEAAYEYLWDIIFEAVGRKDLIGKFIVHSPGMEELRGFLKDAGADKRPFMIILDEAEPWFNEISDQSIREKNRSFLEKFSELANEKQFKFFLLTALRGEYPDPRRTMSRECRSLNLTAHKRVKIIPYRLFEEGGDEKAVERIIRNYVNEYKRYVADYNMLYTEEHTVLNEMLESYPFHPLMLHILFKKYTSHPSYQNTRGLLYLLSNVVRDLVNDRDMFLLSDADVERYKDLIGMLDRRLTDKAITSIDDARRFKIEYGCEIVSTLFYHSLVEVEAGATELELLQSVFRPGLNPTELLHSVHSVVDTCTYVKRYDGRLLLGPENPESIVKNRSSRISMDEALGEIADMLNEIVGRGREVYLLEFSNEKIKDTKDLKLAFTLMREEKDDELKDRLESYLKGRQYPNLLVFLVPERGVDLTRDEELITLAKKAVSARDLSKQPGQLRNEYMRIISEKRGGMKAKLVGERWGIIRWVKKANGTFDIRPLPIQAGRLGWREISRKLREQLWNKQEAEALILGRVEGEKQIQFRSCLEDFHTVRGYPLPINDEQVHEVVRKLCSDGQVSVEQRGKRYYRQYVESLDYDAKLLHPSLIKPEYEKEIPTLPSITTRPRAPSRVTQAVVAEPITEFPEREEEVEAEEAEMLQTVTLADTEDRYVRVGSVVNDVENKLQEVDLIDKVLVREPTIELTFKLARLRDVGDQSIRFSDVGVREVEASLRIGFTELRGKELLEWLRRAPDIDAKVKVRGKIGTRS